MGFGLDITIIVAYFAAIVAIGLYMGRRDLSNWLERPESPLRLGDGALATRGVLARLLGAKTQIEDLLTRLGQQTVIRRSG